MAVVLASSLVPAGPAAQRAETTPRGEPTVTLETGCEVIYDRGLSAFTAVIRNTGDLATSLTLGIAVDDPAAYHPTNVGVLVSANGDAPEEFRYFRRAGRRPRRPLAGAAADGAEDRVRIPSASLVSTRSARRLDLGYLQGSWQVRLILHAVPISYAEGGTALPFLRLTTGTLEAAAITVPDACTRIRAR